MPDTRPGFPLKTLPAHPDIEQYKKQAKEMARACRDGDAAALERLQAFHPQSRTGATVKLADAQLVLARERGFESWAKFAAHIEQLRIAASIAELANPADAFLRAALVVRDGTSHAGGTLDEANAILLRYPRVAHASIYTASVLGDEDTVRAAIARDPGAAQAQGGPYGWDALTHACFSRYLRIHGARSEAFIGTARALLDAGANPNTGWWEEPNRAGGQRVWESALYGAAGVAHHAELTRLLLERGGDPNDGETPYHTPEGYDNAAMRVLLESGKVDERGKSWMLARKSDWHDYEGLKLTLEHGADPNFVPHWGNSALQHAILRDNGIEMLRLLLEYGADPLKPHQHLGRTPVAMAAKRGRGDFLLVLDQSGVDLKLDGVDGLIAACARADGTAAEMVAGEPGLRARLLAQGGDLLGAFAGVGNTEGVRCLLDLGVPAGALYSGDAYFDTARDSTALHVAAWRGRLETMRLLIERGTPVNALDGRGRSALQLAVRACVDSYWRNRRSPEWVGVLVEAGASKEGIEVPTGYAEADRILMG